MQSVYSVSYRTCYMVSICSLYALLVRQWFHGKTTLATINQPTNQPTNQPIVANWHHHHHHRPMIYCPVYMCLYVSICVCMCASEGAFPCQYNQLLLRLINYKFKPPSYLNETRTNLNFPVGAIYYLYYYYYYYYYY